MLTTFLDEFAADLKEVEQLLSHNRIFIDRCENVGYISREDAVAMGMTGPILRAAGVQRDLRRDNPYLTYPEFDFNVITFTESDALARFYVRFNEMVESAKILRQALQKMPAGAYNANDAKKVLPGKQRTYTRMEELIQDFMITNMGIDPPIGEVYQGIESSKGEFGFYIVSDGTGQPWRLKIRSPSMVNISALPIMCKGGMVSDIVAIVGSIDPVMGEADK